MNWSDYFIYADGQLIWRERPLHLSANALSNASWNSNYAGKVAGHEQGKKAGLARYVRVHDTMYRAHRIVWEMHNGPIPEGKIIDHWNQNPYDNRLENLRIADKSKNGMNRSPSTRNKSGVTCVTWDASRQKWAAWVSINKKRRSLGRFNHKGEAAIVAAKASLRHYGKFSPYYKSMSPAK